MLKLHDFCNRADVGTQQSGFDVNDVDFANFADMNLSGYKFEDINGDEDWNGSDDGLSGWTILIDTDTNPDNGYLLADVTDADGKYEFTGLTLSTSVAAGTGIVDDVLGNYIGQTLYVYEVGQSDYTQTYDGSYDFEITSGFTKNAADGSAEEGNFGNFELFDISGTKYNDLNGNGQVDDGEPGLAGWTIFIDTNDDGVLDWTDAGAMNNVWDPGEGERWTQTDGSGNWSMTDLDASYHNLPVKEILEDGWVQTLGPVSNIVATSGNDGQTFDFANFADMSLSGYKFADIEGDEDWNGSDDGLDGWTILIDTDTNPDNGYLLADVTDADGKYEFTGLTLSTSVAAGTGIVDDVLGNYIGQTLYVYEVGQGDYIQTYDGSYDFEITSGFTKNAADGSAVEGNFGNFLPDPSIDIEKSVKTNLFDYQPEDADDDPDGLQAGTSTTVSFKLVVTNTGNEVLSGITLTDSVLHTVNGFTSSQTIVYTPDLDPATLDAQNVFVDINNNQSFDAGEEWSNFDTDGDGTIDAGVIEELAPGESFTVYYDLTSQLGQHENTGSVEAVSAISATTVSYADDANYYVLASEDCVGVGTPGFWSNNGAPFWDGVVGGAAEEKHAGKPGFADGELTYDVYLEDTNNDGVIDNLDDPSATQGLLIGDYNQNGYEDNGEDTIFISLADALDLIDASARQVNGGQADGIWILGRDTVATWLNFLANNQDGGVGCIGEADNPFSPQSYLNDAIDWLQTFAADQNDDDSWIFEFGSKVKTKSDEWKDGGIDPDGDSFVSGATTHNALDDYNNFGAIWDPDLEQFIEFCCDRDSEEAIEAIQQVNEYYASSQLQDYLALESFSSFSSIDQDGMMLAQVNAVV